MHIRNNSFMLIFLLSIVTWLCVGCGSSLNTVVETTSVDETTTSESDVWEKDLEEEPILSQEEDEGYQTMSHIIPALITTEGARGIWVWRDTDAKISAAGQESFLNEVAKYRAEGDFYLFMYLNSKKLRKDPRYRTDMAAFLTGAHQRGYKVHALGGEVTWIDRPQDAVYELVNPVKFFNRRMPRNKLNKFDGIHLDVEAHMHSAWTEQNNQVLLNKFLRMQNRVMISAELLPTFMDLPPWYLNKTNPETGGPEQKVMVNGNPVGELVSKRGANIVLLSYRNNVDKIEEFSRQALEYFQAKGKPCSFGVETQAIEPAYITYAGLSYATLDQDLRALNSRYRMGGFIHHWDSLKLLLP